MPILSIQAPMHLLPCRSRAWKGAAMDAAIPSVSASHLAERVSAGRFPCHIDVRREEGYAGSGTVIRVARHRPPEQIDIWAQNLARDREIIVYCVHGREVSQSAAAALYRRGFNAAFWWAASKAGATPAAMCRPSHPQHQVAGLPADAQRSTVLPV